MLFLEYPKCSTCQKAKKWLDANGIAYEDRNIKEQNPTAEELRTWREKSGLPLKKFFNTSGLLYKEMALKDRLPSMTDEEQYALLATDGMLVKRPLLIGDDFVLVGFKEAEWILKVGRLEEKRFCGKALQERFEFRTIRQDETDQAIAIEQICFPPNEACSPEHMRDRVKMAPELFLTAVDKETGRIVGFLNGLATNETVFRDEFFTDAGLYEPAGKNIMLLGLDVLPEYRKQGLARELVSQYVKKERENNRGMLLLTCVESKVKMYEKMGFRDLGIANSSWGGEEWHEMSCVIGR